MKYITLIGLLVVGCGGERKLTAEEEKAVGTYERKDKRGYTWRWVFLDNGTRETWVTAPWKTGKPYHSHSEGKWKISKEGEMHIQYKDGRSEFYRINKDGSLSQTVLRDEDGEVVAGSGIAQTKWEKIK